MRKYVRTVLYAWLLGMSVGSAAFGSSAILEKHGINMTSALVFSADAYGPSSEQCVFIPRRRQPQSEGADAAEGTHAVAGDTDDRVFRLLGNDGKAHDLKAAEQTGTETVNWGMYSELETLFLVPAAGTLPEGCFVAQGRKEELDRVSITWNPVKPVSEENRKPQLLSPQYVDIESARKEFKLKAAGGEPLAGAVLQRAGIATEKIKELTAVKVTDALRELMQMPTFYTLVDPAIVEPYRQNLHYAHDPAEPDDIFNDLWNINCQLLLQSYPRLFILPQEFVPAKEGSLSEDPENDVRQPVNEFLLLHRSVYEAPGMEKKLLYDQYIDIKASQFGQKRFIAMIGTVDKNGKIENYVSTFVDGEGGEALSYSVGDILGTVEIADQAGKEIWIICDYIGYECAHHYSSFQYYPDGPVTKERTGLLYISNYPELR
jgi:hypothetical protein